MSSQGSNASSRGGGSRTGGRGGGGRGGGLSRGSGGSSTHSSGAASATATARMQAGYASSYVVPKAKNSVNQPLLETLALQRSKIDPNRNKFAFTLKTAMDNLAKHPDPVNSYKEACQVRGIGQKIAHMLFPTDNNSNNSTGASDTSPGNPTTGRPTATGNPRGRRTNHDVRTTIDGIGDFDEVRGAFGLPQRKKMKQTTLVVDAGRTTTTTNAGASSSLSQPLSLSQRSSSMSQPPLASALSQPSPQGSVASHGSTHSTASTPTRRQLRYHKEKSASDHQLWKSQDLVWNVVFLLDNRERKDGRDRLSDKFSSANIPFEVRQLPIGDMTWIAQGRKRRPSNDSDNNNSSPSKGPVVVELLLGTIIERKTLVDLKASIYGTRYAEQRMRMADSGLSQCMLLVEGNLHRDATAAECHNKFLETCHTALWETCLYMKFQILRTADLGETISTLKLLHRRILQRSFPHAFAHEILPTFDGPNRDIGDHPRSSLPEQQRRDALDAGQRRRRRYQSLHKLVFDTVPVMPPGMDRYVTYAELKAKIGRDREAGLRTVRMVHGAMIKQVPKIENKKAAAIVQLYPTPHQLFAAYHSQPTEADKQLLLRDVDTAADKLTTRKCTVGLEASKQMYVAYGMSKTASERPSYAEHVERVQQQQQQQSQRRSSNGGASSSSNSGEKPPASSRRPSFDVADSFALSQASSASSRSTAATAGRPQGVRTSKHAPAHLASSKPPPVAGTGTGLPPKPAPPTSSSSASRPAPHQLKPPPYASTSSQRQSQSQDPSARNRQGASSQQGSLANRSGRAAVASVAAASASQEAVIDLCDDDDESSPSTADDAKRSHRSARPELGNSTNGKSQANDTEEEDEDDDYDYSPVVKDPAYCLSVREPLVSLPNGVPTAIGTVELAPSGPVANPLANAAIHHERKNRYSLGSLASSTSSSSSVLQVAAASATAGHAVRPSQQAFHELGLESDSSDDDDDDDEAKKPPAVAATNVAALLPKRKAREPEVYEILSD